MSLLSSIIAGIVVFIATYLLWSSETIDTESAQSMVICVFAYLGYDIIKAGVNRLKKQD